MGDYTPPTFFLSTYTGISSVQALQNLWHVNYFLKRLKLLWEVRLLFWSH